MSVSNQAQFAKLMSLVATHRDQTAFAKLFEFFAPRVNAYLTTLGASSGICQETTQEVMSVMWLKADLYDPAKSSVSTWLFRIARNKHIDALRKQNGQVLDPNDPMLQPYETPSPSDGLDSEARMEIVKNALEQLKPDQRELVRLAFFGGMSQSDIAKQTNLPLGTVKSRTRLAFEKLRHVLGEYSSIDDV